MLFCSASLNLASASTSSFWPQPRPRPQALISASSRLTSLFTCLVRCKTLSHVTPCDIQQQKPFQCIVDKELLFLLKFTAYW